MSRRPGFRASRVCLAWILAAACSASAQDRAPATARLEYPEARRGEQTDDYHGVQVADPYRWLEDTDSKETRRWIEQQNEITFGLLKQLPQRERLIKRLTELWNYERFGLPLKRGGKYFFTRNDGLQDQSVLLVADELDGQPRLLLDPNQLSEDGTVALTDWAPSDDGRLLAYGLAAAGSDWNEWKVLDTATGQPLEDHLNWVKFSDVSWTPDGKGFYYSRYDEPAEGQELTGVNYFQKLYYHRIGQPQSQDRLVYQRKDEKEWGFDGHVTEDGRYLVITVWRGTEDKNLIFYKDLRSGVESPVVELIDQWESEFRLLGSIGDQLWLLTDNDAPNRRVITIDLKQPTREDWKQIVSEGDDVLEDAALVGGRLVASYLHDAHTAVNIHNLNGGLERSVELPAAIGSARGFEGRQDDTETFYSFSNFTSPGAIFRYDVASGETETFREPDIDFDASQYVTKQVFVDSDGARVPMFITHRRGLKLTGDTPTLLYAYGGFNISMTPRFSVSNAVWLEQGGIYAQANLRGGGEYGRQWHEAGMKEHKQNVFDDFVAAAEWLIDNRYTNSFRLAIRGRSNGGLLVGAVMCQRPDLFGAALPGVGVMDMLRFHKFTIGWAWVSEYGSSDDKDEFAVLRKYSPLHNLRPGVSYPPTLITTADHDDRVVPGHSFKFAAELQHCHAGDDPVLIRIETSAGHGAGTPTSKLIEAAADELLFLHHVFDM